MAKTKFNHESENVYDAIGVNKKEFEAKGERVFKEADKIFKESDFTTSKVVEHFSKNFTKVELAHMVTMDVLKSIESRNPSSALLEVLAENEE